MFKNPQWLCTNYKLELLNTKYFISKIIYRIDMSFFYICECIYDTLIPYQQMWSWTNPVYKSRERHKCPCVTFMTKWALWQNKQVPTNQLELCFTSINNWFKDLSKTFDFYIKSIIILQTHTFNLMLSLKLRHNHVYITFKLISHQAYNYTHTSCIYINMYICNNLQVSTLTI